MSVEYIPVRYTAGQATRVHARWPEPWRSTTVCGQYRSPADTDWRDVPGEPITCQRCLRGMQLREKGDAP